MWGGWSVDDTLKPSIAYISNILSNVILVIVYDGESTSLKPGDIGFFSSNTVVTFEQAGNGSVRLTGKAKG